MKNCIIVNLYDTVCSDSYLRLVSEEEKFLLDNFVSRYGSFHKAVKNNWFAAKLKETLMKREEPKIHKYHISP